MKIVTQIEAFGRLRGRLGGDLNYIFILLFKNYSIKYAFQKIVNIFYKIFA